MEVLKVFEKLINVFANDRAISGADALRTIESAFFSPDHPDMITIDAKGAVCLGESLRMDTAKGEGHDAAGEQHIRIRREDFLQYAGAWLSQSRTMQQGEDYVMSGPVHHPLRPDRPVGLLYSRHIPHLGSELSFRGLDPDLDQENLHAWMNNERVNAFWGMKGPPEVHRKLLQMLLSDKHAQPLIGAFDGAAFGYFDVYWAKEDKVGQYYDAADYDRGLHMLVGEDGFRGAHRVAAWLPSLAHYAFLDEPRTERLVCEPRIDNERMIDYLLRFGFTEIGPVDFPHKKALLLILTKDAFLKGGMRPDFCQPGH